MKSEIFFTAVFLFSFSAASTVATFHGQLEKRGPETSYTVGFASDEYTNIDIDVPEKEGLNISYAKDFEFDPDNISHSISRQGTNIPVKEFKIEFSSVEPIKQSYSIPVTLRAYAGRAIEGRTTPRVVHERSYTFSYLTENSPDYNFEGSLIGDGSERKEAENDISEQKNTESEENSLTEENQTSEQERLDEKESDGGVNPVLLLGVLLIFSYVFYEAVT